MQTPQVFGLTTLMRAHHRIGGEPTDDLSLVEEAGGRVRLVEGERANFKITYPEDLELAEKLI